MSTRVSHSLVFYDFSVISFLIVPFSLSSCFFLCFPLAFNSVLLHVCFLFCFFLSRLCLLQRLCVHVCLGFPFACVCSSCLLSLIVSASAYVRVFLFPVCLQTSMPRRCLSISLSSSLSLFCVFLLFRLWIVLRARPTHQSSAIKVLVGGVSRGMSITRYCYTSFFM